MATPAGRRVKKRREKREPGEYQFERRVGTADFPGPESLIDLRYACSLD